MTKEEITNKIIIQENKVRSMFINLFKDHFSSITTTDYEAKIDLSGFTYNNKNSVLNPIYIELKERSNEYSIQYLDENIYCVSGGTYLEAIKLDYFIELYKSNPYLEDYTIYKQKPKLFNELKKIKVLEGNDNDICLYTNRFEDIYSKDVKYLDLGGKISFKYSSDFTKSKSIEIKILKNNLLTNKKVDFCNDNFIGMILEDIDNDGVKEILILLNFYVMNGDSFILTIYKFVE